MIITFVDRPENFTSNNKNLTNLKAGDFFLTVREASNCTVTLTPLRYATARTDCFGYTTAILVWR
jgi:hypothetical protein